MGRTPAWEGAYREFFVARQRSLMRTAYAILGSWPAAEDAVQTAFTQLYVHWPRIQPGAVDTYARRTVVHTCFRMAKVRGRETGDRPGPRGDDRRARRLRWRGSTSSPRSRGCRPGPGRWSRCGSSTTCRSPRSPASSALPEGTVKSQTARALERLQSVLAEPEHIERNHHDR